MMISPITHHTDHGGTAADIDPPLSILVIDDRGQDRESLVALLKAHGYQAAGVAGGKQARRHLENTPADLALVDMVMPGQDGIAVLKELKFLHPLTEVILITAYATLEKAVAGLREGAYDFLTKPCPTDTLIAAVERVREKKNLQRIIKNAEERLRQSEYFFHAILESLGEAVVVIGRDMRIISANAGYRHQTKMENGEIRGQHCYKISHGYSRPCWLEEEGCACAVIRCFQDGGHHTAIHTHRDKDGNPIYVETNAYPLRRGDNQVYAVVETIRDITELKEIEAEKRAKEAEIHRLAFFDPLTGLPNRRLLLDRLNQSFAASARTGQYGALLFIDLDRFKNINDTRGHQVGDLILRETARRLLASVREDDTVSRQGGDEFVVLLLNLAADGATTIARAGRVAEKIRLALGHPFRVSDCEHNCEFHVSASIGITLFLGHQESAEDLFKYADTAMYQAKQAGRDTARFFDPAMQAALEEAGSLERDLRQGLADREQLALHYQPQVDAAGRLLGAEALLRWTHPQRGPVSPLSFIPLAEENGMILPIGRWVLQTACRQLAIWMSHRPVGLHGFRLAVNVSARQFHQPEFVAEVREIIAETGINPANLKLELTETLVLSNLDDTIAKMRQLQTDGIDFAMDDFGTGYSSLAKLKLLPLAQLKIDRAFIRDLATAPHDAAIVKTIIAMGRTLGFEIVAEGVENEEQLRFLQEHGCNLYQGYHFNPPLPAAKFTKLL